jgi:transposase
LYLAPYSPELKPIERALAKLKASLGRAPKARSFGALIEAMGRGLGEITDQDASGFFRHCGYRAPAQLL